MKKVIVILILVIYVASIAVINVFFKPIGVSETNVYYKDIWIKSLSLGNGEELTEPSQYLSDPMNPNIKLPVYQFEYTPPEEGSEYTNDPDSLNGNPNNVFIQIDYTTTSDDQYVKPSNQNINVFSNDNEFYVFVLNEKNERTIVFHRYGAIIVTLQADDAHKSSYSFWLICLPPSIT